MAQKHEESVHEALSHSSCSPMYSGGRYSIHPSVQERLMIMGRFGAVLEEFEVQDALHNVFATKYGGFTFE